jgi:aspartate/methionine/tyrosine aminotransferase
MSFHENTYLQWYFDHAWDRPQAINLFSSGVARLDPRDFPMVTTDDPWEQVEAFEAALGSWLGIPREEVVFTPGATGGSFLALLALTTPRQDIVVEQPIYEPMVRQAGRIARTTRLRRCFGQGWRLPLAESREAIGGGTGMVMITEPHNPSGICSSREDVLELAAMAAERGARLLVNEVYRGFTDQPSYHRAADNIVVVNSLSKLFGTYAMRLGWLSAPVDDIEQLRWGRMNMSAPATPCAGVGLSVMKRAEELKATARLRARGGHSAVAHWVDGTPEVTWHEPHGVGYGCVRIPSGIDDVEFAERLCDRYGVLVIPGSMFDAPGTIRLSWLEAGDHLEEGLQKVASLVHKW